MKAGFGGKSYIFLNKNTKYKREQHDTLCSVDCEEYSNEFGRRQGAALLCLLPFENVQIYTIRFEQSSICAVPYVTLRTPSLHRRCYDVRAGNSRKYVSNMQIKALINE